jgi:hypothetical protein
MDNFCVGSVAKITSAKGLEELDFNSISTKYLAILTESLYNIANTNTNKPKKVNKL